MGRKKGVDGGHDCKGKVRLRDEADASDALARNRRSNRDHKATRYYYCDHCGGFHLTSQGKRS